ncbi:MAG: HlyU family transcriptional regulator [Pseudomonadota bacterium]
MSLLSRLFGGRTDDGASDASAKSEEYAGFTIVPEPIRDGGKWRIGARIKKDVDGEAKEHLMIRADMLDSEHAASEASLGKARTLIDQQGERLFG